MADTTIQADILIDVKKYRLRIYKSTLHELGDPMYIQLLVNPEKKHLVIVPVDKKKSGDQTLIIGTNLNRSGQSCEVYSMMFISKLCGITGKMDQGHSYRVKGEVIPSQRIALFYLDTIEEINPKGQGYGKGTNTDINNRF